MGPQATSGYTPLNSILPMGIIRSLRFSVLAWVMIMNFTMDAELALGGAAVVAILFESTQHRTRQNMLIEQSEGLKQHLHRSGLHIEELQLHLRKTSDELHGAMEEIYRRDAVGSPAARALLSRQELAMEAQSKAIEVRGDRNEILFDGLERLLVMQADQTSKIQQTLTNVVENLATEPHQKVPLDDSVLNKDGAKQRAGIALNQRPAERFNSSLLMDLFD